MTMQIASLSLKSDKVWMEPSRASYRPPSWPPPRNWVVSEDRDGNVISEWGHSKWDLTPWADTSFILNFHDKETSEFKKDGKQSFVIDTKNADLLRLIMTWKIWGSRQGAGVSSIRTAFILLRKVVLFCSGNGILISELNSHPNLIEQIPSLVSKTLYRTLILELHRVYEASKSIGFLIVDSERLKKLAYLTQPKNINQTPYIPPRIWSYQVKRLKQCIDGYIQNKEKIEQCFKFCCDSYSHNIKCYGRSPLPPDYQPFASDRDVGERARNGCEFHGQFMIIARRYGIQDIIEEWISIPKRGLTINCLDTYLNLVEYACSAYIANFTLQRCDEVGSLKENCLIWEYDEKLGRIPIICGPTSKTVQDSDARWPTSPAVEIAVLAAQSIVGMRKLYPAYLDSTDNGHSYLRCSYKPLWGYTGSNPHSPRRKMSSYCVIIDLYNKLFDLNELTINSEDLKIAKMLTPSISYDSDFAIGSVWKLAWHQLRRTGAVNMFCSGLISDSSMQQLMKHSSRFMPLYYGAGYTKLLLNEEVAKIVVNTMYEVMTKKLELVLSNRFISPFGQNKKDVTLVNLISESDVKALTIAARKGQVSIRETRAGVCLNREPCEYGGIESISRCAGSDGRGACTQALFDREKLPSLKKQLEQNKIDRSVLDPNSPRHKALAIEAAGIEGIIHVIIN